MLCVCMTHTAACKANLINECAMERRKRWQNGEVELEPWRMATVDKGACPCHVETSLEMLSFGNHWAHLSGVLCCPKAANMMVVPKATAREANAEGR